MTQTADRQTVFVGDPNPQARQGSQVFRHIVMFRMDEGTTNDTVDEAFRLMVAMCEQPMVIRYELAQSKDERKGVVLVEIVDFPNEAALETFKDTQPHGEFVEFICVRGDWFVTDYHIAV